MAFSSVLFPFRKVCSLSKYSSASACKVSSTFCSASLVLSSSSSSATTSSFPSFSSSLFLRSHFSTNAYVPLQPNTTKLTQPVQEVVVAWKEGNYWWHLVAFMLGVTAATLWHIDADSVSTTMTTVPTEEEFTALSKTSKLKTKIGEKIDNIKERIPEKEKAQDMLQIAAAKIQKVPHPVLTGLSWLTAFVATTALAFTKSRAQYRQKSFLRRVSFSLNYLSDNTFKFRTLFEKDLDNIVMKNRTAMGIVETATKRATKERPFLQLPKEDAWWFLNLLLNELSEMSRVGYLRQQLGLPVRSSWYVYSLTFEKDTATRFQKLRVMVIEEKFLTSISEFTGHPKFEHPFHYIRWNTLKQMSELYIKEKATGRLQNFRLVELVVPDETAEARSPSPHPLSPSASSHLDPSSSNSTSPTVTPSY